MSHLYYDAGDAPAVGQQKFMLATPTYDSPDASYTFSIARSREALHKKGIATAYLLLQGNCHVDDSRNSIVSDFLASDCTDLVFLDADVSWEPEQLLELCGFECDVVGGVYPYRRESGKESMPVRNIEGVHTPDENGLLEVEGLPTGFLRIRRHVIESMAEKAVTFSKAGKVIPILFERDIWRDGRRGGDIHFCMKWREMGGKLFAAANLRLGHCGKHVVRDSLAASLRRQLGTSLEYVAERIRTGNETEADYHEALKVANNPWGAQIDVLSIAVLMARKATGPILEMGTGLTTVLMAAANPGVTVWAVEHSAQFAWQLKAMAHRAGVGNIALVTVPLKDEWYDLSADMAQMPERFSLALVDGPPRIDGDRMHFFDVFGGRAEAIVADDADDPDYCGKLRAWADKNERSMRVDGRAAVILKQQT